MIEKTNEQGEVEQVVIIPFMCGVAIGISLGIVIENLRAYIKERADAWYDLRPEVIIVQPQCKENSA